MPNILTVLTLGKFSVSIGERVFSDTNTRSSKIWKIFKYLLTNRHKMVPVQTLIDMLWSEGEGPNNPEKALYTLIARLRKMLGTEKEDNQYILFQHDSYQWNPNVPMDLDVITFEKLVNRASSTRDDGEKLRLLQEATDKNKGNYLAESSSEIWVIPVGNYYKRLYIRCVADISDIYSGLGQHDNIISLCSKVIESDPYEESAHVRLIQALFINGDVNAARQHHRRFLDLMKKEFGISPSEEFRNIQTLWDVSGEELDLSSIKRMLDDDSQKNGVYFCTLDIFNQIYKIDKRSNDRMQFPVFLALITVGIKNNNPDDEKTIKSAIVTLRQCLKRTLRRGDIVSPYSKNQFLMLLSARENGDAEAALIRIKRLFNVEYTGKLCQIETSFSKIG
jgi:DNA-binding SARP family transcriptional activator